MKTVRVAFFDSKAYDIELFNSINEGFGFEIKYFTSHLNADTVAMANGFDAVCVFVNDTVSAEVLSTLERLSIKLVALRCAGYNNVDLKAAYGKVHIVRVPAYSPHAVAEHTVALMLSLNRKIHKAYTRTRDANFSLTGLSGFDMHGKTAGIIGTGRIGKVVAAILNGFGMHVLAFDTIPDKTFAEANSIAYKDLDALFYSSDIITLHCPLTPQTIHLIDAKAIDKMKNGVMIINTGRGKLIDTRALIYGLKSGKIGYAGLDVYEEEEGYFFEDLSNAVIGDDVLARLLTFPNVLVTSHQAYFTGEALSDIAMTTLSNLELFFNNHDLHNEICFKTAPDTQ